MLDSREVANDFFHSFRHRSRQQSNRGCRQHVFEVVSAFETDIARGEELSLALRIPVEEKPAAHECTMFDFRHAAEKYWRGGHLVNQVRGAGVVGVQHGKIRLVLVHEDAPLGGYVGLEAGVPIQVVGRNIQDRGHHRMQAVNGFELKAR